MKIKEYIIVRAEMRDQDDKSLAARVNKKIVEGYQPFGSMTSSAIFDSYGCGEIILCQPMVKYE